MHKSKAVIIDPTSSNKLIDSSEMIEHLYQSYRGTQSTLTYYLLVLSILSIFLPLSISLYSIISSYNLWVTDLDSACARLVLSL